MTYRVILVLAILLYLCSLALPGMILKPDPNEQGQSFITNNTLYGYDILTFGAVSTFTYAIKSGDIRDGIISVLLFLFSPFLACACIVTGSFGVIAWYGNVLFVGALISIKSRAKKSLPLVLSGLAVIIGLFASAYSYVGILGGGMWGPKSDVLDHFAVGYYVWEAALLMLAEYCLVTYFQSQNKLRT